MRDAFGADTSFSDFNPGYPSEPDPRRLAPKLKFVRTCVHRTPQEERHVLETDHSQAEKSVLHAIEIFMQRPPRKASNKWIMESIVAGGPSENLGLVRFGPAFEVAIEQQVPGCSVIGGPIKNLHYSP